MPRRAVLSGQGSRAYRADWSSPDPAAVEGSNAEKRRAFRQVAQQVKRRIELLASLPFEKLDALRLEAATKEIGIREKIQIGSPNARLTRGNCYER